MNTFADGSEYEGEWMKDVFNGYGIFRYYDGKVHVGRFENGKKHGRGELSKVNGEIVEGDWENDTLVKIIREENVKFN